MVCGHASSVFARKCFYNTLNFQQKLGAVAMAALSMDWSFIFSLILKV